MQLRLPVLAIFGALVFGAPACAHQHRDPKAEHVSATRIHGIVRAHDGGVPQLAHVRVLEPSEREVEAEQAVGADGRFALNAKLRGFAWLELTGVDHAQQLVPIVLDGEPIELTATLGTYPPSESPTLEVWSWDGNPEKTEPVQTPMTVDAAGYAVAEIPTKKRSLRVQVVGIAGAAGRAVNPPRAGSYEYDGGGDYRGIMVAKDGKVRVEVDRSAQRAVAPKLVFAQPQRGIAAIAALGQHWPPTPESSSEGAAKALWEHARTATDPLVRRAATAMALDLDERSVNEFDASERALATAAIDASPFGDSLWLIAPLAMARAVEVSGTPAHHALLERVITEQLSVFAGGMVLVQRLAQADKRGDEAAARKLYARLSGAPWAEVGFGETAAAWNPDRKVKPGAMLPSFELAGLRADDPKLRSDQLRGKIVLIELWATWCQPCVNGMKDLHALHTELAAPRPGQPAFEIVSISMDDAPKTVEQFRKQWPMPWLHMFAGKQSEEIYAKFETGTLPFTVLIDERGEILEASAELEPARVRELVTQRLQAAR